MQIYYKISEEQCQVILEKCSFMQSLHLIQSQNGCPTGGLFSVLSHNNQNKKDTRI
jgi:hypothetical protein